MRIRDYGDGGCKGPYSLSLMLLITSHFLLLSPFILILHLMVYNNESTKVQTLGIVISVNWRTGARQPRGQSGGTGVETVCVTLFFR